MASYCGTCSAAWDSGWGPAGLVKDLDEETSHLFIRLCLPGQRGGAGLASVSKLPLLIDPEFLG